MPGGPIWTMHAGDLFALGDRAASPLVDGAAARWWAGLAESERQAHIRDAQKRFPDRGLDDGLKHALRVRRHPDQVIYVDPANGEALAVFLSAAGGPAVLQSPGVGDRTQLALTDIASALSQVLDTLNDAQGGQIIVTRLGDPRGGRTIGLYPQGTGRFLWITGTYRAHSDHSATLAGLLRLIGA